MRQSEKANSCARKLRRNASAGLPLLRALERQGDWCSQPPRPAGCHAFVDPACLHAIASQEAPGRTRGAKAWHAVAYKTSR